MTTERNPDRRRERAIQLLGPVSVTVGGAPLAVDTRKATALLAYLAVTDRRAARETLAVLLWPESDEVAARGALRRTLSVLNAGLGGEGLRIDRTSVALDGRWEVDVGRFRAALASVRRHGHAPGEACDRCMRSLDEAVELARGEFMAGFSLRDSEAFDDWQRAEAAAHQRDLAGALERLARARAARADAGAAVRSARRWLELDPLHEPAHRLLMRTLALAGEQGAAIRQYRECVRMLDAELGVPPLDETTALYEAIRSGQVGPQPPVPLDPSDPRAPAAGPADGSERRDHPLVGRETALARLLDAYRAIGPDGRLFIVEGEPGIGKTRVSAVFAAAVRARGGRVIEARAYAGESSIPFGPIGMLVRAGLARPDADAIIAGLAPESVAAAARVVGPHVLLAQPSGRDVGVAPLDAIGRARAIEAVAELLGALTAGPTPGLLMVDDADHADDSTLEVLAFIARRLAGHSIGIVLTGSPRWTDELEARRIVAVASRYGRLATVTLERLTRDDVATLARAVLGSDVESAFVDWLFAESEGLPLYASEMLAAGPSARHVPRGVLELLRARIRAVDGVAGQLLAAASVVGRSFDFETVRAASGRGEEETVAALEELVARGLVREVASPDGEVRLDFTHGRLRDVAYESLGLVRRRLLHRRIADALRSRPSMVELARWSRIAHHEAEAGRPMAAAEAHARAAAHARAVFANREAREHLQAALALEGAPAGELHQALGEVLTLLGDYASAIGQLEAAAALADPPRSWVIERDLALVHARRGDWPAAASHIADALAAVNDDTGLRAVLLADRSAIAGRLGDRAVATSAGAEALELAEESGDEAVVARASHVLAVHARRRGDLGEAARLLDRALAAADGLPDPGLRIASLNTLALLRVTTGDPAGAIGLFADALRLCERQGDRHRQAALENNLADVLRSVDRRDEAMEHLKRAVAIFADIGGQPGVPDAEIWKLVEW